MDNTQSLAKLGYREIDQLADLLKVYADAKWTGENELRDEIQWEYNADSDNLFLVDEDYNVAMLNLDNKLEMFLTCMECGHEGFASEDDKIKAIADKKYNDGEKCGECYKK